LAVIYFFKNDIGKYNYLAQIISSSPRPFKYAITSFLGTFKEATVLSASRKQGDQNPTFLKSVFRGLLVYIF